MTIEVNDVRCERLLSSEVHPQTIAAQLLPENPLFRGHVPAQFGGTPQQLRIYLLT
jgi:hypothetical protein